MTTGKKTHLNWTEVIHPRLCSLTVEFDYTPPQKGTRDCYGVPLEPDYPAEIELVHIWFGEDEQIDLIDDISLTAVGEIKLLVIEQLNDIDLQARLSAAEDRCEKGLD